MLIVFIAWGYVVLMMALAEALSPNGTVLGALGTLTLYGIAPMSIVAYLFGAGVRRRARRLRDASAAQPDGGHVPPGDAIAPERKEP